MVTPPPPVSIFSVVFLGVLIAVFLSLIIGLIICWPRTRWERQVVCGLMIGWLCFCILGISTTIGEVLVRGSIAKGKIENGHYYVREKADYHEVSSEAYHLLECSWAVVNATKLVLAWTSLVVLLVLISTSDGRRFLKQIGARAKQHP